MRRFQRGGLAGAGSGAIVDSFVDYGVDDDFARSPNALFLLVVERSSKECVGELSSFRERGAAYVTVAHAEGCNGYSWPTPDSKEELPQQNAFMPIFHRRADAIT